MNSRNCKVNYFNEEVIFDNEGKAKVKDELGSKIVSNFSPKVWEEGKRPETKISVVSDSDDLNEKEEKLNNEVSRLNSIILEKDKEIFRLKDSEKTWREEYEKIQKLLNSPTIENSFEEEVKEEDNIVKLVKKYGDIPEGYEEIIEELSRKPLPQIKGWIKNEKIATAEDIKDISDRDDLIKFVIGMLNQ